MKKKFEVVVKAKAGSGASKVVKTIEEALEGLDVKVLHEQLPRE